MKSHSIVVGLIGGLIGAASIILAGSVSNGEMVQSSVLGPRPSLTSDSGYASKADSSGFGQTGVANSDPKECLNETAGLERARESLRKAQARVQTASSSAVAAATSAQDEKIQQNGLAYSSAQEALLQERLHRAGTRQMALAADEIRHAHGRLKNCRSGIGHAGRLPSGGFDRKPASTAKNQICSRNSETGVEICEDMKSPVGPPESPSVVTPAEPAYLPSLAAEGHNTQQ